MLTLQSQETGKAAEISLRFSTVGTPVINMWRRREVKLLLLHIKHSEVGPTGRVVAVYARLGCSWLWSKLRPANRETGKCRDPLVGS